jgi:hypothetical protein
MYCACLIFLSRHFELVIFSNLMQRHKSTIYGYFGNFRIYIVKVFRIVFITAIVPLLLAVAADERS